MRSKNGTTNEKLLGSRRSMSVPPGGGKAFYKLQKILADSPKWKSVTANECGQTFGERNSATLGANLFRQEREATMQYKMRTVEAILKAFDDGNSELDPVLAASRSMLPSLNPSNSKLKVGAGYIKVDLSAAEHSINVFTGEQCGVCACLSRLVGLCLLVSVRVLVIPCSICLLCVCVHASLQNVPPMRTCAPNFLGSSKPSWRYIYVLT